MSPTATSSYGYRGRRLGKLMKNRFLEIDDRLREVKNAYLETGREIDKIARQEISLRDKKSTLCQSSRRLRATLRSLESKRNKLVFEERAEKRDKIPKITDKEQTFLRLADIAEMLRRYLIIGRLTPLPNGDTFLFLIHPDKWAEQLFLIEKKVPGYKFDRTIGRLHRIPCPFGGDIYSCSQPEVCSSEEPCTLVKFLDAGLYGDDWQDSFQDVVDILLEMCRIDGKAGLDYE